MRKKWQRGVMSVERHECNANSGASIASKIWKQFGSLCPPQSLETLSVRLRGAVMTRLSAVACPCRTDKSTRGQTLILTGGFSSADV